MSDDSPIIRAYTAGNLRAWIAEQRQCHAGNAGHKVNFPDLEFQQATWNIPSNMGLTAVALPKNGWQG